MTTSFFQPKLVGISLTIIGVPLGMYLNYFSTIQWNWSTVSMLLSVLLLVDWRNLLKLCFPSQTHVLRLVALFQIIMLFYAWMSPNLSSQFLSFHLYVFALCMAYASLPKHFQVEALPKYLCMMSLPCLILGFYCYVSGLMNFQDLWEAKQRGEVVFLEPFTIASGTLTCMFSAICMKKKKRWENVLFISIMLMGIYTLLVTTKRTPVFVFLVGVVVFLYCKGILSFRISGKSIRIILGVTILLIVVYLTNGIVHRLVDRFSYNFFNGVLNFLGDTSVRDTTGSAYIRVERRDWAYQYIDAHFDFRNYIFGGGYMTRWLDNPILQAYLDMGIIGFLFYGYLIVYYPGKVVHQRINDNVLILSVLLSVYAIASILNSGIPYQYLKYTPVCLLAFVSLKVKCS